MRKTIFTILFAFAALAGIAQKPKAVKLSVDSPKLTTYGFISFSGFHIKEDTIDMDYTILDLRGGKAVVLDTTYTAKDNEALQTIRYKFINKPVPDKELTITNYWNGHFKIWEFRSCEFRPYRRSILLNSNTYYFNNN